MKEFFEIFSESGKPLGLAPRGVVHREGYWHKSVNVFLFSDDGRLLLQRRSKVKDVCPNAWDLSVAEHLKPGESFSECARRGAMEELGLTKIRLQPVGSILRSRVVKPAVGLKDLEFQQCFTGSFHGNIQMQEEEVAAFRLVEADALLCLIESAPLDFTPWLRQSAVFLQ